MSKETKYVTLTLLVGEFEKKFPEIASREDLNQSDKIRVALGLEPRKAAAGAPKGNNNAVGNVGRWQKPNINK